MSLMYTGYLIRTAAYGGQIDIGRRKTARPLSTHYPMIAVFKVRDKNKPSCLFTKSTNQLIKQTLQVEAKRSNITLLEVVIKPYLLKIKFKLKEKGDATLFFRSFTSKIAVKINGYKRKDNPFWAQRIFTQIIEWASRQWEIIKTISQTRDEVMQRHHDINIRGPP